MKINAKKPSVKTYTINHFDFGDICMSEMSGHYYLVVESENAKKQLVDLTDNKIIRVGTSIPLIPTEAELNVKSVG